MSLLLEEQTKLDQACGGYMVGLVVFRWVHPIEPTWLLGVCAVCLNPAGCSLQLTFTRQS